MNKNIWVVVGALVILAAGWFAFGSRYVADQSPNPESESVNTEGDNSDGSVSNEMPVPGENGVEEMVVEDGGEVMESVITYTDDGFSPAELTVEAGTEVTFVNSSSRNFWPASAMHPTHKVYPGSGIEKCGTDGAGAIFDACVGIAPGASYVFTFNEVGEWGYHDHLRSSEFGRVIVTEASSN